MTKKTTKRPRRSNGTTSWTKTYDVEDAGAAALTGHQRQYVQCMMAAALLAPTWSFVEAISLRRYMLPPNDPAIGFAVAAAGQIIDGVVAANKAKEKP